MADNKINLNPSNSTGLKLNFKYGEFAIFKVIKIDHFKMQM